jgi:hypothetical protein
VRQLSGMLELACDVYTPGQSEAYRSDILQTLDAFSFIAQTVDEDEGRSF